MDLKKTKYPKLQGICAKALENNLCLGCNLLDDISFSGKEQCSLVQVPKNNIKTGIQQKIEFK